MDTNPTRHGTDRRRILSIDVGTSSVRASLFDPGAEAVAGSSLHLGHDVSTTADGGAFFLPDALVEEVAEVIDRMLANVAGDGDAVCGVAFSAFWHNVIAVNCDGQAVTPCLTWADTRAAGEVRELRKRLDPAEYHTRTGCTLHPSYLPAKLVWLRKRHPELQKRNVRWLSLGDYVLMKLFGRIATSTSMASASGLFNQESGDWDEPTLAAVSVHRDELPEISDQPYASLRAEWSQRWPELANVPWFPAAGDGACDNVGSGCVTEESMAVMVGTSGALRVVCRGDSGSIPDGLWCYHVDAERLVVGGALSNGGNFVSWVREVLGISDWETFDRLASSVDADAHGLTILPFIAGERSPGFRAGARGVFSGFSWRTQPADFARAALEAVAYRLALIHRLLLNRFPGAGRIVATGAGLVGSSLWRQIVADVFGVPVTVSSVDESSLRGAALLAMVRLGWIETVDSVAAPLGETSYPDHRRHNAYCDAVERQVALYGLHYGGEQP